MSKTVSNEVVITGVGPVTSVGVGSESLWDSLVNGRSNVVRRTLAVDAGRFAELPVASMPPNADVPGLAPHMEFLASQDAHGSRDVGYALLAIELALADAGVEYDRAKNSIGVIQAFEAPGSERTTGRLFELIGTPIPGGGPPPVYNMLSPFFYNMQPFVYVHLIGKLFGLRGFSTSVHNACASGAFAIEIAAQRIRTGQADAMIVVGGEAFETGVRLEWFRRLNLYAEEGLMRPFDSSSSGFYVGEGAAAMVLESAEHAARRGADVYARYLGGAFAHQGWKQIIPDVRASRLADVIVDAMKVADVSASDLDLIVPHGAGTQLSDGYEASCLAQALEGGQLGAIATVFKPHVGHMLAASGIVEMVCLLLSIRNQAVPATLNSQPERTKLLVPLATTHTEREIKTVLKLSTGFTGHDAASLFGTG